MAFKEIDSEIEGYSTNYSEYAADFDFEMEHSIPCKSDCSESYSDSEDSLFLEPIMAPNSSPSQGVVVSSFESPSKSETQQGNLAEDCIPAQESKMEETEDSPNAEKTSGTIT